MRPNAYLLDTHTFLWLASDDSRLPARVRRLALRADTTLILSVASIWELAIKASLGKLDLRIPLAELIDAQRTDLRARLLPIEAEHAMRVESLEFHHRDPFDRLLVAQAAVEDVPLLSADVQLDAYPIERFWG